MTNSQLAAILIILIGNFWMYRITKYKGDGFTIPFTVFVISFFAVLGSFQYLLGL